MNQADVSAICFVLPAIVFLAVLWALLHQREQQLREVQGQRILNSLREVLRREESAKQFIENPRVIPDPNALLSLPSIPVRGLAIDVHKSATVRLHQEKACGCRTTMGDTLNQAGAIRAQTNSVDVIALRTEHAVIEWGLQTLGDAVMGGAKLDVVCDVATTVLESLVAHFAVEEQMLRDSGLGDLEEHIVAHQEFVRLLQEARTAVSKGHVEATLDIVDILNALQENVSQFARPEPGQLFRQDGELQAGTIQVNWT